MRTPDEYRAPGSTASGPPRCNEECLPEDRQHVTAEEALIDRHPGNWCAMTIVESE